MYTIGTLYIDCHRHSARVVYTCTGYSPDSSLVLSFSRHDRAFIVHLRRIQRTSYVEYQLDGDVQRNVGLPWIVSVSQVTRMRLV